MPDDPASLSKLHDIIVPEPVSWWPLAPGWWVLIAALAIALAVLIIRALKNHRANAYRRAALADLQSANSPAAVAVVLRRTALAVASRTEVAALNGSRWVDWLDERTQVPIPDEVRGELSHALYESGDASPASPTLRTFAENWIKKHSC